MHQPHSHHPGHTASSCPNRMTITRAASGSMSSNGYACSYTGGHCRPSESCKDRIDEEPIIIVDLEDYQDE